MAIYSEEIDPNLDVLDENKPKTFRVVLEIEVDADNPLEAAKTLQGWLKDDSEGWQFYVQEVSKKNDQVYSVDLNEEDEDAVYDVDNYIPMIK